MACSIAFGCLATACDTTAQAPELVFDHPLDEAWSARAAPIPTAVGDLALITNNLDDTLSYVDLGLTPPAEIMRLPVGLQPVEREGPHHLTLAADGLTMWVGISNFVPGSGSGPHGAHGTGTADGSALLVAVDTGDLLASVRVDRNPGDIRLTPDGKRVLVTHFDLLRITGATPGSTTADLASRLAIIDVASRTREALVMTCPAAHGMAVSPDSRRVFIACWDDQLAIVDLVDPAHPVDLVSVLPLPGTIADPECQPYALTQSPDGATVWVGCFESGELRAFDTASGAMDPTRVVTLGSAALFGSYLSTRPATLVVPAQGPDQLAWIDAATGDLSASLVFDRADCILPHVVQSTSDGKRLLVVCEGDRVSPGTLVVVDPDTRAVTDVVPLGRFPDDLALRPATRPP